MVMHMIDEEWNKLQNNEARFQNVLIQPSLLLM